MSTVCRQCQRPVRQGQGCYGTLCEDCWVDAQPYLRLLPTPDATLPGGPFPQRVAQGILVVAVRKTISASRAK